MINKFTLLLLSALQATNVFASASSSYPTAGASSESIIIVRSTQGKLFTVLVTPSMTGQKLEELASLNFGVEGRIIVHKQWIDVSKPLNLKEFMKSETIHFVPFKLPTSESLAQHAQSNPEYATLISVMDAIKNRDWSTAHRRFDQLDQAIKDNEKFGKPIAALLARRK